MSVTYEKWAGMPTARTTLIPATSLASLASGSNALGSAILPSAIEAIEASVELVVPFAVAPTNGASIDLYFVPTLDGSNYADGSVGTVPAAEHLAGTFTVRDTTNTQRLILNGLELPPTQFKAVLANTAGQAFASAGASLVMLPVARLQKPL